MIGVCAGHTRVFTESRCPECVAHDEETRQWAQALETQQPIEYPAIEFPVVDLRYRYELAHVIARMKRDAGHKVQFAQ